MCIEADAVNVLVNNFKYSLVEGIKSLDFSSLPRVVSEGVDIVVTKINALTGQVRVVAAHLDWNNIKSLIGETFEVVCKHTNTAWDRIMRELKKNEILSKGLDFIQDLVERIPRIHVFHYLTPVLEGFKR